MEYKYNIALSFSGKEREFTEITAQKLKKHGVRVFYDKYEQHVLWGKNLHEKLKEVYTRDCRHCVILITESYLERMWPNFERQQIIDRLTKEHGEDAVLPVRLDGFDKEVPGLSNSLGYIEVSKNDPNFLVNMILKKLGRKGYEVDSTDAYHNALQMLNKVIMGF